MKDDAWEDIGSSLLSTDTDESLDTDVAVGGRDRTTLVERIRASSRLADARRYAREHRLRVASLLGVTVLLVTGTAYLLTRPPPVDPVIRVSVAGSLLEPEPSDRAGYDPAQLVGRYVVRTDVPGDRVQVVGVVGPGLHDGTGSPEEAVPGQPVTVRAGAETDCATPGWLPATAADYRLRLIRTDAYDRLVESDVPLGDSASEWLDAVHTACRRAAAAAVTVRAAVFDAPPGRPTIGATLSLDNDNPFPVWVQRQDYGYGTGPATQIGPGESAEVPWRELIAACDWAEGWSPWYQDDDGVTYMPMRLDVEPLVPVAVDDDDPRALALRVDDQVAGDPPSISTCRGAPRTVVDVSDVRRVRSAGTLRWELDLQIHVAAPQVGLGFRHVVPGLVDDPTAWDDGQLVRLPSRFTETQDGLARVGVTYAISSCDDAQSISPPGLYVTAIRGDRRYPRWITLGDRAVLDAIRVACDGRPTQQEASENGWPASEA